MKFIFLVILLLIFFSLNKQARAGQIHKVIRVKDGDTIVTKDRNNKYHTIRLAGIDAPEDNQPFGDLSTHVLKELIDKKEIRVKPNKRRDYHGRTVAKLYLKDLDINNAMVKLGAAWVYKQYAKGKSFRKYYKSERTAKKMRRGLWASSNPIAPWAWRRLVR